MGYGRFGGTMKTKRMFSECTNTGVKDLLYRLGDGSVGKVSAVQASGTEFGASESV